MVGARNKVKHLLFITTALVISFATLPTFAQDMSKFIGDAKKGKKIFKKCKACHRVGKDAKNATGPVLNNVVGRHAGTYPGYKYGKGMKAASAKGLVWDPEKIFNYVANPKKYLRAYLGQKRAKAKMKFKLKKADQRKDVVAYLVSISDKKDINKVMGKEIDNATAKKNAGLLVHDAKADEICIQNNFKKILLLTAEAKGGERQTKTVGQSGYLCIKTNDSGEGTVGVFENAEAMEGCSRLAKAGKTEVLIAYASFDNCAWK